MCNFTHYPVTYRSHYIDIIRHIITTLYCPIRSTKLKLPISYEQNHMKLQTSSCLIN
ncbi:hypothetical protein HanPSC8_Chr03g0123481 [Helianthus annuus]|nr:hypothetical protein HanPSC8_Chr03g0123481 [Helianthus annuus]